MGRLVEQESQRLTLPEDVLFQLRREGQEARVRRMRLAQLPDEHFIGGETRGPIACTTELTGSEAQRLVSNLRSNLTSLTYFEPKGRIWSHEDMVADAMAAQRETSFWLDTESIATITRGVVVMPHVVDCFGVLVRSNIGVITARHRSLYEGYSIDDVRQAVLPHLEAYNGEHATDITIALVGIEGAHHTLAKLKQKYDSMKPTRFVPPSIVSQMHQLKSLVRSVSRDCLKLNVDGSRLQLTTEGGTRSAYHYLVASTHPQEADIYHIKHIFK